MKITPLLAALATTAALCASQTAFAQAIKSTSGMMSDAQGKTLYIFSKDAADKSNCAGGCLAAWPAFVPKPEAKANGDLGIITRDDGTRQWTHKTRPLYYYVGDSKPGDKTGDKQGGVWFVLPMAADGKGSQAGDAPNPVAAAKPSGYTY
jgi:predicted lipoprotein with Yx(FWY)xxD motif